MERLRELSDDLLGECLATQATTGGGSGLVPGLRRRLRSLPACTNTICAAAAKRRALTGKVTDDRPCMWCGDASDQPTMVLCDRCNACYHPHCAEESEGTRVHGGPWFCHSCKGFLALWGAPDVTQGWPLMDYLWTGALP